MMPKLRPEIIGPVGENFFDSLALKADLLVASVQPDSLGKDRIIEFNFPEYCNTIPYDKRTPPIGCSIQIKTILQKNEAASVKLSVAERLAADFRPAFICIIRVDDNLSVVDMYIIHILGDVLGRVLKRLRQEYVRMNKKLNRSRITFNISEGTRIAMTPDGFKGALMAHIGVDIYQYCSKKQAQRDKIGYDGEFKFLANMTIEASSIDEVVDGMLGLKKLKLTELKTYENRFQIPVPVHGAEIEFRGGTMEVSPTPIVGGFLRFINANLNNIGDIDCKIIVPPMPLVSIGKLKIRVITNIFDIILTPKQSLMLITYDLSREKNVSLDEIVVSTNVILSIPTGVGVELYSKKVGHPILGGDIRGSSGLDFESIELLRDTASAMLKIASQMNIIITEKTIGNILDDCRKIHELHEILFGSLEGAALRINCEGIELDEQRLSAIYIGKIEVLEIDIYYSMRCEMSVIRDGKQFQLISTKLSFMDSRVINAVPGGVERFKNDLSRMSGCSNFIENY